MPIRLLPDNVAAQIAAGEVIERPVSVVKELIENSVDAGANQIHVDVEGSGIDLVRVSDNGSGIPSAEVKLALERHATSKLTDFEDLYHIHTLGFRGEALASIASVAQLTLASRHVDEQTGMRIVIEGGKILSEQAVGIPSGTTIEVRNLFFNVPARRKFLKSETTERRHVANLITNYAMAYPDIRFSMHVGGRESFRTSGSGQLGDVIIDTLGLDVFREMVEVLPLDNQRPDLPPTVVSGYTTAPHHTRANRSQIILFINGRQVQDQRLVYAVVQAYHGMIEQGRYPVCVLMIQLPPEEVDVNVHPTKAEVRFRSPDAAFSAVQRAVRKAILEIVAEEQAHMPSGFKSITRFDDTPTTMQPDDFTPSQARVVNPQQLGIDLDIPEGRVGKLELEHQRREDDAFVSDIPTDGTAPKRPRTLPNMRVIGQVAASYIVAEGPAGLYLVDQHAAHERILFDEVADYFDAHTAPPQHTLESAVVELSAVNARFLDGHLAVLKRLGFEVEAFGVDTYRVRTIPAMIADYDPADIMTRMLQGMDKSGDVPEDLLRRLCKLGAVKAGQVLSRDEMQSILRQLERTSNPHQDPSGKPTMIHMSTDDLAREFGRH